jgi:formate/nitrite transporter FocA (FNT family)
MIKKNEKRLPTADASSSAKERDKQSRDHVEERETREQTPTESERSLTHDERESVAEHGRLSALTVYSIILREGEEELHRPKTSLWWSGVAAGIGISTSVLAEATLRANLAPDLPYLSIIESFGYSLGFVLVIMCRLQLFTENTLTVVLPVLTSPSRSKFYYTSRLWGIVFAANMVGTFFTAFLAVHSGILDDKILSSVLEISRHVADIPPTDALLRGIPAGFFIAALVWMLPSAKGSEVQALARACSRSAMMSLTSSMPTDRRTTSGPAPAATCCSSVSWRWVVEAGWMTSERVSPILARCENISRPSTNLTPES